MGKPPSRIERAPGTATGPCCAGQRGGGYYLDDGPGANPPADIDSIPDAVPRIEPLNRGTSRPYTVMGRNYTPLTSLQPYKARGIASWYGRRYNGKKTSSGEIYDMYGMTAAHTILPIPSYARVTNPANGKSVIVRINDRGPFYSKRIIDLSYAAAERIGLARAGSGMVEVERVFPGTLPPATETAAGDAAASPQPVAAVSAPTPVAAAPSLVTREPGGLWLQLGAFSSRESAESFRDRAARELSWIHEPIDLESRDGLYRVRLGPYRNPDEASAIADKVRRSLGFDPLLTR